MRFTEILFAAYGCFTDTRLTFGRDERRLHIIYGPNEAGKSTALRGLSSFLYGIPPRTTDNFVHNHPDLRISARLIDESGHEHEFLRRKKQRETLLDPAGAVVPESRLMKLLGNLPQELFESAFRINHDDLVAGGLALLQGKGELAESLFQAGSGVVGVRAVLAELDTEAEAIFKKSRSANAPLNESLDRYRELCSSAREKSLPAAEWQKLSRELEEQEQRLQAATASHREHSVRLERLRRIQQSLPLVSQRRELAAKLLALAHVPRITPAAAAARDDAMHRQRSARSQCDQSAAKIRDWEIALGQNLAPLELLERAPQIQSVLQQVDGYRKAAQDRPKVELDRERLEEESRALLAELDPELPLDAVERLRLTSSQRSHVDRLADEFTKLETRRADAEKRVSALERSVQRKQAELAEGSAPPDPGDLRRVVAVAQRSGDLDAQIESERKSIVALERDLGLEAVRLRPWNGDLARLEELPVPPAEALDRFVRDYAELENQSLRHQQAIEETSEKLGSIDQELKKFVAQGAVQTEQDLEEARRHRDLGWKLVRRAWLEGEAARDRDTEARFTLGDSLDKAYSKAVSTADDVADRLRREAERVARLVELQFEAERWRRRLDSLALAARELQSRVGQFGSQWQALWQPCAMTPDLPAVMRAWLNRYHHAASLARQLRERQQTCAGLELRQQENCRLVSQELEKLGIAVSRDLAPALVLQLADEQVELLQARRQSVAESRQELNRHHEERRSALDELQRLNQEFDQWRQKWREVTAWVGTGEDTRPDDVRHSVQVIDEICAKLADMRKLDKRVEVMQSYLKSFEDDVAALTGALAEDLRHLPADAAATELRRRQDEAQEVSGRRRTLKTQVLEEREVLRQAEADLAAAAAQLEAALHQAGCKTLEECIEQERKSREIDRLEEQLARVEQALSGFTGGLSLSQFDAELSSLDVDRLAVDIEGLVRELEDIDTRRSAAAQEVGRLRSELGRHDGSADAVQDAEAAQEVLAKARGLAENYARLKLSAGLLRRHLETYRQQSQDPVLRRASALFSQLTSLAFARLESDFDDNDRPVLYGVRASGKRVAVEGMSAGTRDQLFLAMRLASLERQLETMSRVPLVVDDILINFDDERSRATLQVLADFAATTQVLFFTHHERLVELASDTVGAAQISVHRLERARL